MRTAAGVESPDKREFLAMAGNGDGEEEGREKLSSSPQEGAVQSLILSLRTSSYNIRPALSVISDKMAPHAQQQKIRHNTRP